MLDAERFVNALLAHIVFLICLLPLVGAALTILSARMGTGYVRSTAVTNALLTLSLTVLMVVNYDPSAGDENRRVGDVQMISVFGWFGDVDSEDQGTARGGAPLMSRFAVRCAVGVDGISLWPIVLTALLTFAAILSVKTTAQQDVWSLYALVLIQQSLVFCLFAALDIVVFCIAFQLSLLPMFVLMGRWGGDDRIRRARRYFILNSGGSLAVTFGLVAVALMYGTLAPPVELMTPRLMTAFPRIVADRGANDWSRLGLWVLPAIVGGLAVRLSAARWRTGSDMAQNRVSLPVRLILDGLFPLMGLYGIARFAVPLLAVSPTDWATVLRITAICGTVYCGLLGCWARERNQAVGYIWLCSLYLAAAGILTLTSKGIIGGMLYAVGMSLAVCTFELAVDKPKFRTACILALLSIPGSAGFAGLLLIMLALFSESGPWAIAGVIGWLTATSALIRNPTGLGTSVGQREPIENAQTLHPSVRESDDVFCNRSRVKLMPFVAIVCLGIFPQLFTSRMERSVLRLIFVSAADSVARKSFDNGDDSDDEQKDRVGIDQPSHPTTNEPDNTDDHHQQPADEATICTKQAVATWLRRPPSAR